MFISIATDPLTIIYDTIYILVIIKLFYFNVRRQHNRKRAFRILRNVYNTFKTM